MVGMVREAEYVRLHSGNEAVALAARDAGVALGTGYPGTPSSEILEHFHALGGKAQWAPNEKVALEVGLGVAFASAAALVTMKHVGLNVAADPFFTAAYSGVPGPLVVVSADDPGMASSQNEQDNRRYAVAAGVPMLEPADSQEAYDFTLAALDLSRRWHLPVLLRMTTRVCHSKTLLRAHSPARQTDAPCFQRDAAGRVMIPMHARPAHRRLRQKLAEIAAWSETCALNRRFEGERRTGIIASGVTFMHACEAAPRSAMLKLGLTHPLPLETIRAFAAGVERCVVLEENDPYLYEQIRAAGVAVEHKPEMFRFGELNVRRVRRILGGDLSPEVEPPRGKAPALCAGCPHRAAFDVLGKLRCIVAGDIGCYTLGALPPLSAMDLQLCMGAGIGMGLGLRHVLPEAEARRVVSVIGDGTFFHSGITGLVEMVYNPPPTGHVVLILDNGTTAMTGLQEHPGTGRALGRAPAVRIAIEDVVRSVGIANVAVVDPIAEPGRLEHVLRAALDAGGLCVTIVRRPCLLAAARDAKEKKSSAPSGEIAGTLSRVSDDAPGGRPPSAVPSDSAQAGAAVLQVVFGQPSSAAAGAADRTDSARRASGNRAIVNVVLAGLGGQGVLTASDILADAAAAAGCDVKSAAVHGMSQRGGSVAAAVRFGDRVHSPMIPDGEADYLVALTDDCIDQHRWRLRRDGVVIAPAEIQSLTLPNRRGLNIALLGVLSRYLDIGDDAWREALRRRLRPESVALNEQTFALGRNAAAA